MSIRIKRDGLTSDNIDRIRTDLTFHSKPNYRYVGGRRKAFPSKESLAGYTVIDDCIRVPRLYAMQNFIGHVIHNPRCISTTFNFTGTLLPKQIAPLQESLNQLVYHGCTLMAFCTGFGKSICMAYAAVQLKGLTLILVDGTVGNTQIPQSFREFTDAKIWVVGEPMPLEANVVVCMDTRVKHLPSEYLLQFTTVIIDEAHCWLTHNRYSNLFKVEPRYLILATATPRDQEGLWPALDSFIGRNKVVQVFDRPFNVFIYHTGIIVDIEKQKNGNANWSKLVKDLCDHPERNKQILKMIVDNVRKGFKLLILTWRENHAQDLVNWIMQQGILASKFTGKTSSYSDAWCIVGTISKINKAFDEKTMCPDFAGMRINLVMLVGSTKSDVLLEQMVGRGFRADCPNIIHLVDDVAIIKRHLSAVRPWYSDTRRKAIINEIYAAKTSPTSPSDVDPQTAVRNQASSIDFKLISEYTADMIGHSTSISIASTSSSSTTKSSPYEQGHASSFTEVDLWSSSQSSCSFFADTTKPSIETYSGDGSQASSSSGLAISTGLSELHREYGP
jgi:hypothetical protein